MPLTLYEVDLADPNEVGKHQILFVLYLYLILYFFIPLSLYPRWRNLRVDLLEDVEN